MNYNIRVCGYFELQFDEENIEVAKGRAKQTLLDNLRDQQGRPIFNITNLEEVKGEAKQNANS